MEVTPLEWIPFRYSSLTNVAARTCKNTVYRIVHDIYHYNDDIELPILALVYVALRLV